MSKTRTPGIVLLIVGGLLIGAGAYTYSRASRKTSAISRRVESTQALLDSTRTQLQETSLRYRAFAQSSSSIPDSIRLHEAGPIFRQSENYQKNIYVLEMKERDLKLQSTRLTRKERAAKRGRLIASAPLAGAGALASIAGLVLLLRSRSRPVAT